ncbi:mucin-4-like [Pleurodeles waltl]|uniref:mucin-4-like n=1 Tax=Pleurodeles waltl TaxID=8319 RepID=UPI003709C51D
MFCCSSECDANHCLNGGTCTLTGSQCEIQACACAVGYEGPRCMDASLSFVPFAIKALPKRTVLLRLESNSNMNTEDTDIKVQQLIADLPVNRLFNRNRDYSNASQNTIYFMDLTSEFNYTGIRDDIKYLNEKLVDALRNKTRTTRAARATSDIALVQVMNGNLTSQADLAQYFGCGAFRKTAYELNPTTFMCESKCIDYCKNNATCNLTQEGPLCTCVPFSIYTTSGDTCDIIAMNLNAFLGILFGALAFLFLLVIAILLTVYWCRKRRREADDESFLQTSFHSSSSLTGFKRLQETNLPSLSAPKYTPDLLSWKPRLDLVNTSMKAKTDRARPQRLSESLSSDSGNMQPYTSSDSGNMELAVSFDVLASSES